MKACNISTGLQFWLAVAAILFGLCGATKFQKIDHGNLVVMNATNFDHYLNNSTKPWLIMIDWCGYSDAYMKILNSLQELEEDRKIYSYLKHIRFQYQEEMDELADLSNYLRYGNVQPFSNFSETLYDTDPYKIFKYLSDVRQNDTNVGYIVINENDNRDIGQRFGVGWIQQQVILVKDGQFYEFHDTFYKSTLQDFIKYKHLAGQRINLPPAPIPKSGNFYTYLFFKYRRIVYEMVRTVLAPEILPYFIVYALIALGIFLVMIKQDIIKDTLREDLDYAKEKDD